MPTVYQVSPVTVNYIVDAAGLPTPVSASSPLPVTIASAGTTTNVNVVSDIPGTGATNLGKAEDAVHASGDTGVLALGVRSDTPASTAGTTGDYTAPTFGAFGQQWEGVVNPDGTTVTFPAVPSLTSRILSSANTTNATSAKAAAGYLYGIQGLNTVSSVCYLKLYNKASAPTVGTDTPVKTIAIQASSAFTLDWPVGYQFSIGIAYALTTGSADADTGAVASGQILGLNVDYA